MSQHIAILINGEVEFCGNVDYYHLEHGEALDGNDAALMLRLAYAKEAIR